MRSKTVCILIIFMSHVSMAQKKQRTTTKRYLKINHYKKVHNVDNINLDSLEFIIHKGDTLIRHYPKADPNKVLVSFDYRDSTFLNYYTPIAFHNKKKEDSLKSTMKYWRNDIKLFFGKRISKKLKKEFLKFVEVLDQNIDSLSISTVKTLEKSNYIVYSSEDYSYEQKLINSKKSSYWIYWNADNKIYKASIKLSHEKQFNDQLKLIELKKLFFQSLGNFRFDNRLDCKHFLANCYSPDKKLTELDLEILKYHYSYGICKGITLEAFKNFHKEANKLKDKGDLLKITHLKSALKKDE